MARAGDLDLGRHLSEHREGPFTVLLTRGTATAQARLQGGEPDPFGMSHLELSFAPKEWHLWLRRDGRLVAHVGVLERTVAVAGDPVDVAGVGGVLTHPKHRGEGAATSGLRAAHAFIRGNRGLDLALLLCRPALVPFYGRLGWARVNARVTFAQPEGSTTSPLPLMAAELGVRTWPEGPVDLRGLPW